FAEARSRDVARVRVNLRAGRAVHFWWAGGGAARAAAFVAVVARGDAIADANLTSLAGDIAQDVFAAEGIAVVVLVEAAVDALVAAAGEPRRRQQRPVRRVAGNAVRARAVIVQAIADFRVAGKHRGRVGVVRFVAIDA